MCYDVIIEPVAVNDLREISDYITGVLSEPVVSAKLYHNIKAKIATLSEMPKRYRVVDAEQFAAVGLRAMPVKYYTVYYIVDDNAAAVHILRVLYNRRQWQNLI